MLLRIVLFSGLILHKLLWEILKRRGDSGAKQAAGKPLRIRLVKLVKLSILIFLCIQTLFLDLFPISQEPSLLVGIGTAIYFVGLATAMTGRIQLGKNWVDLEDARVMENQQVVAHGIYRYIRHPIYTGDILLLFGLQLALNSWLVLGVPLLVMVVVKQVLAEESMLEKVFKDYSSYCQRTKRFIPFLV